MKKCMEFRVEGRRPVGRPRSTWLESVETDMAELEIDKEDVHYEEEVQPYRKTDNEPIIYIYIYIYIYNCNTVLEIILQSLFLLVDDKNPKYIIVIKNCCNCCQTLCN